MCDSVIVCMCDNVIVCMCDNVIVCMCDNVIVCMCVHVRMGEEEQRSNEHTSGQELWLLLTLQ